MSIETLTPMAPNPPLAPAADPRDVFHEFSPLEKAVLADWKWLDGEFEAGRLDPVMDRWIVVLDRRIINSGPNGHEMRVTASEKLGVPQNRIVLAYVAPNQLIG